jgi:CubicO group peptidase (beta-lactamase class C family)
MNRTLCAALAAMCLATCCSPAGATPDFGPIGERGDPVLEAQGKYIDQRIAEFMKQHNLPGMTMAIVQAPYIPRSAGYGRVSLQHDEMASTRTMWSAGPITQGFTAVALFQLYEAHKLALHDQVGKYLKDLPAAWQTITLFQLLQHSSGIPDYRNSAGYSVAAIYKGPDLVSLVRREALLFMPGTRVQQSATNFALLGLVIEKASGMPYHDFVTRYQIEAVGMRSTMFASDFALRSRQDRNHQQPGMNQHVRFSSDARYINPVEQATGYTEHNGSLLPTDAQASANLFAFGDIWSSAEDISTWDIALAGSVLIKSADNRAVLYGSSSLADGTKVPAMGGWEFTHHPGFMDIKGSTPGFSAYLSRFTAKDELVCVTLLTNKEGVDLTGLARDVAEAYKAGLGSGLDSDKVSNRESEFSVQETAARLTALLEQAHVPLFATIDHAENAVNAGLSLRPTRVLVLGNPKVGTQLMLDQPASALDLPLRIGIWEDERHRVWVGYHNMRQFAADWQLQDAKTALAINDLLDELVRNATSIY